MSTGVYIAKLKNGNSSYRSSITFKGKHISLGSFMTYEEANSAYVAASNLVSNTSSFDEYENYKAIPFDKFVSLLNFRDNNYYIKNPIYLMKSFFYYYLCADEILTFDIDDLFYYSNHKIQKRGGRLFCADYGMQVTLGSRYGLKSHAVAGRDYIFLNGDTCDYRYDNLRIINRYNGVQYNQTRKAYKAFIHINGNFIIGYYENEETAAIAYNKAADYLTSIGSNKKYLQNYIETISAKEYADIYSEISLEQFKTKVTKAKLF